MPRMSVHQALIDCGEVHPRCASAPAETGQRDVGYGLGLRAPSTIAPRHRSRPPPRHLVDRSRVRLPGRGRGISGSTSAHNLHVLSSDVDLRWRRKWSWLWSAASYWLYFLARQWKFVITPTKFYRHADKLCRHADKICRHADKFVGKLLTRKYFV